MRHILWRFFGVVGIASLSVIGYAPIGRAVDTSRSAFYSSATYNGLISDGEFAAINAMSAGDIQAFLEGKNSYLAKHSEGGRSAAQIIYDAAHGHGEASGTLKGIVINGSTGTVSPKVLLVTLQKEQSLITLTEADRAANPTSYQNRLDRAMGYGCPDSGGCNDTYKGFTNQVEWAAWQLRYNYEIAGQSQSWWDANYPKTSSTCQSQYIVGRVCSFTNSKPESWIPDSTSVTLGNKATASLYRYTPHVFNGNYNFWYFMQIWFNIGGANVSVTPQNDTNDIASRTYGASVKVSGSKASGDFVYFGGNLVSGAGATSWEITISPDIGARDYTIEYRNSGGAVIATKKVTIERRRLGDIDGDGSIELKDLSLMGESYGVGVNDGDWRDLNSDSVVDILDLSKLSEVWP